MADIKKGTLNDKKKKLESELKNIQEELDNSLDNIKSDVTNSLDPVEYIRRHPLKVVGVSMLVGFLAGKESGGYSSKDDNDAPGENISATLWYELKRLITRKGISFASDYIEDLFSDPE